MLNSEMDLDNPEKNSIWAHLIKFISAQVCLRRWHGHCVGYSFRFKMFSKL